MPDKHPYFPVHTSGFNASETAFDDNLISRRRRPFWLCVWL
jgi:hypothetical protein